MIQFQENAETDGKMDGRTEGQKDRQTLFHRTLPADVSDPKVQKIVKIAKINEENLHTI